MLMRSDPFREFDRLAEQVLGTRTRPAMMPIDAYRQDDSFVIRFDLPGVEQSSIDLTIEKNVLSVSAERGWEEDEGIQVLAAERPQGSFRRQLFLGEGLDTDRVEASHDKGVLTVTIPVADQAKPRKVEVSVGNGSAKAIETGVTA